MALAKNHPVLLLCSMFLCLFLIVPKLRAEPTVSKPQVVLLAAMDNKEAFDRVVTSMEAQFRDSDVGFSVHWISELPGTLPEQEQLAAEVAWTTGALAVLWVDLKAAEHVYFHLTTRGSKNVLVRRLEGAGQEGLADALALISKSAVDSVLEGGQIGVIPSSNDEAEGAGEPIEESPPRKMGVLLDVSYAMAIPSPSLGVTNGGSVFLSLLIVKWLRINAGYTLFEPLEDTNSYATLELTRHPIHLGLEASAKFGRWSFGGGASLIFDYLVRAASSQDPEMDLEPAYGQLEMSVEPALRAEIEVIGPLALFLSLGAEIHFVKRNFYLEGGPDFFEDLYRVEPRFLLGGSFRLY